MNKTSSVSAFTVPDPEAKLFKPIAQETEKSKENIPLYKGAFYSFLGETADNLDLSEVLKDTVGTVPTFNKNFSF